MVKTVLYKYCLPFTVAEYKTGQLYLVAKASEEATVESGGDVGVEVLTNEPFTDEVAGASGQYTHKRMHLGKDVRTVVGGRGRGRGVGQ